MLAALHRYFKNPYSSTLGTTPNLSPQDPLLPASEETTGILKPYNSPEWESPKSADIAANPLELKRICMFKVMEIYQAFASSLYTTKNLELGNLFTDLGYLKIIDEVVEPLKGIIDSLNFILEDIRRGIEPPDTNDLPNIFTYLKSYSLKAITKIEEDKSRVNHSYFYSQSDPFDRELDPLAPIALGKENIGTTLYRYLYLIAAKKIDLDCDPKLHIWIGTAMRLEAEGAEQNELLSTLKSPALVDSSSSSATYVADLTASSSIIFRKQQLFFPTHHSSQDLHSLPHNPQGSETFNLSNLKMNFNDLLEKMAHLYREIIYLDPSKFDIIMVESFKTMCVEKLVNMSEDLSLDNTGLEDFTLSTCNFHAKPTEHALNFFATLLSDIDDFVKGEDIMPTLPYDQLSNKADEQSLFNKYLELYLSDKPSVNMTDLCYNEEEWAILSKTSHKMEDEFLEFQKIKNEYIDKTVAIFELNIHSAAGELQPYNKQIINLYMELNGLKLGAMSVSEVQIMLFNLSRDLTTLESYINSLEKKECSAAVESHVCQPLFMVDNPFVLNSYLSPQDKVIVGGESSHAAE